MHPEHGWTALTSLGSDEITKVAEHKLTPKEMGDLAGQLNAAIRGLLDGQPWMLTVGKTGLVWRAVTQSFTPSWGGDRREIFLMAALDLLVAEGSRISRCAWEPCGKLFVRRKRGAYCSRSCSQKARTAKYRDRIGEEKWREKRHEIYEQRMRKLTRKPKLRVPRRKRRKGA